MSTHDPDASHRLVDIIQPTETLSRLLEDAASEIRPAAMALKTCEAMTRFEPSGKAIDAVLKEFADTSSKVAIKISKCNNIDPREIWVQYDVVVCQQGLPLSLARIFAAVVIRLFEVESLQIRASDPQGNTTKLDWEKGAIAVLAGGCNLDISGNGKLVCLVLTYKRKDKYRNLHDNTGPGITDL